MKSLIYLAIVISSFVSQPVGAAALPNPDEPLIVKSQLGVMGLELTVANLEQTTTTVTLTCLDNGDKHFTDIIRKHNGYSYNLHLDELPEGRYCLAVKKGKTLRQQILLKTADGVMCSDWK